MPVCPELMFLLFILSQQSRPAMEEDLQVHPVVDHQAHQPQEGLVLPEMVLLEADQSQEWPMVLIVP